MSQRVRILIVDDDEAVRLRLRDLLERDGQYDIFEMADGGEGLRAALEAPPDLVLLDLHMPGLTGFEVCAGLRADPRTREVPVIVLSSADESEAMVAALEAGADDFLRKPFAAPELRAKVKTITRLNRFRALARERDRFRWLLDHSQEPLIIADDRGALVYANAPARAMFDLGAEEGGEVGAALARHFRADPADALTAWRERRLPREATFTLFQPETPQVAARWFEVELHALDGEGGQTLMKFTDRTGTMRRELEAFTFQHLISHKMRTPLNGLTPILEFLGMAMEGADADMLNMLKMARESAERLEGALLAVLRHHEAVFAPRSAAGPIVNWRPLAEVVASVAQNVGLHGRVATGDLSAGVAQPEMVEVVLGELLENYAKFSDAPQAGVKTTLRQIGTAWELQLFAPGPGLPPDVVARLGQPYAQLERQFSGEVPGMGLGLATVRTLLRARGGDLLFTGGQTETGLVSTIVLPSHLVQPAAVHSSVHA
jgi:CheY-like chemotaxis protein